MEIFKTILGFENYSVSNFGRIRNDKTGIMKKSRTHSSGYCVVGLSNEGVAKTCAVHRLVASAFIENLENKMCVDHINSIRSDNRLENLRMATHIENGRNQKISKNNISGVKGVYFFKRTQKWHAQIHIKGKAIHIGYFKNLDDAKNARQQKAFEMFGDYINECEK